MEVQFGQITNQLFGRPHRNLPSNTEKNPREEVNAINLKSRREGEEMLKESKDKGKMVVIESLEKDESESSKKVPKEKESPQVSDALTVSAYKPKIPFPAKLKQQQLDQ